VVEATVKGAVPVATLEAKVAAVTFAFCVSIITGFS
jgi:hypothetical protein